MKQIYIYEGSFDKGDHGWVLVKEAVARYGAELSLPYDFDEAKIRRTDKGKPFFEDVPVEFSLSHSGCMWMCMFADCPCGLDLQIMKQGHAWEKISRRYYTAQEQHYVALWGIDGFFQIWVRKEAFGKCTGQGFFSKMPSMVDDNAELCKVVEQEGTHYYLDEIEISPDVKCAYCMIDRGDEPVELRILG